MLYCLQFALLHDLAIERVRFSLAFFLVFLRSSFLFWHFLLVSGLANVYDRCHIPIPLLSFAFFTSMLANLRGHSPRVPYPSISPLHVLDPL